LGSWADVQVHSLIAALPIRRTRRCRIDTENRENTGETDVQDVPSFHECIQYSYAIWDARQHSVVGEGKRSHQATMKKVVRTHSGGDIGTLFRPPTRYSRYTGQVTASIVRFTGSVAKSVAQSRPKLKRKLCRKKFVPSGVQPGNFGPASVQLKLNFKWQFLV